MSATVAEMPSARPTGAKARTNAGRGLLSLSGRRSDSVASGRPQLGVSVRRNPKDSLLEKLRPRQGSDPLAFSQDFGPDGTRMRSPMAREGRSPMARGNSQVVPSARVASVAARAFGRKVDGRWLEWAMA